MPPRRSPAEPSRSGCTGVPVEARDPEPVDAAGRYAGGVVPPEVGVGVEVAVVVGEAVHVVVGEPVDVGVAVPVEAGFTTKVKVYWNCPRGLVATIARNVDPTVAGELEMVRGKDATGCGGVRGVTWGWGAQPGHGAPRRDAG